MQRSAVVDYGTAKCGWPDEMRRRRLITVIWSQTGQAVDRTGSRLRERIDADSAVILWNRIIGIDEVKGRTGKIIFCPFDRLQSGITGVELLRIDARLRHGGRHQDQADQEKCGQHPFANGQMHEELTLRWL